MSITTLNVGIFPRGFSPDAALRWPLVPAGEIVDLIYGDGLTEKKRTPGPIPVYGTNGRCGWHDTPLTKGPGVILGRKGMGPLGVEWCESDFWVIDTAYYVRPKTEQLDLKYFYYLVKYIGLNHLKDGTSNPSLTRDTFRLLLLPIPPRATQNRVQNILTEFDDKIELNRRMNESLESLARRLFKSWFVDFDPVHAKAAVRRQHPQWDNPRLSREALPNLDPKIAELIPDGFEESTLGPIPKGWKCGTFSNIAGIAKHSVTPGDSPDEEFHHYSIPAYDDGKRPSRELGATIKSNKFIVTPECVLLTKLNPRIPRVWLPFPDSTARSICSTEFLVLKPCPGFNREFVYSHVSSRAFFEVYETMVTGTSGSHQRIRPEHLLAMASIVPPEPVCSAFADAIGPFLNESESLRQASATLAFTRERLLPQLLSGEIQLGAA